MTAPRLATALCSLLMLGCSTTDTVKPAAGAASAPVPVPVPVTAKGDAVTEAISSPFNDLNLIRAKIPDTLLSAKAAPYALPPTRGCDGLRAEVQALDAALGADLDTPPTAANPGLIERGADTVGDAAGSALRGAAEGLVPFRSWVRKLTGAERNSRELAAAIAAGTVRRAFLKGVGLAQGCTAPATPQVTPGKT